NELGVVTRRVGKIDVKSGHGHCSQLAARLSGTHDHEPLPAGAIPDPEHCQRLVVDVVLDRLGEGAEAPGQGVGRSNEYAVAALHSPVAPDYIGILEAGQTEFSRIHRASRTLVA